MEEEELALVRGLEQQRIKETLRFTACWSARGDKGTADIRVRGAYYVGLRGTRYVEHGTWERW